MPLTRRCPTLSTDLVREIAAQARSGADLVAMQCVSSEWRAAVNDESWKQLALRIYPHIDQLVKAHSMEKPCYRLLFRDQLLATSATAAAASPPPSGDERLAKFVFTIQLSWTGDDAEANLFTWVGRLRDDEDGEEYGVCCHLFEAESRPKWSRDLCTANDNFDQAMAGSAEREEASLAHKAILTAITTHLRTRMLVSELTPTGMRTLLLCEDVPLHSHEGGMAFIRLCDDKELPLTSFDIVTCADDNATPEKPNLRPWLDTESGQLDSIFGYGWDHARADDDMNANAVADYLEHFAPWRAQGSAS